MPDKKRTPLPPSREGRSSLTVWLPKERLRRLRHVAIEVEKSLQDLVDEGIEVILDKYETKGA